MKIILSSDVDKLGRKGDIVDVAPGYARNFLLPKKLAMLASRGALKQAESMQRARAELDVKERAVFEALAQRISSSPLKAEARVGEEGQMFGSVTNVDIAEKLTAALGEEVDRRKIVVAEPIKSLGTHSFSVHLRADVIAQGTIEVVEETS